MNDHEFQPGTLVRLKSGGPVMTVDGHEARDGAARCVWFTEYPSGVALALSAATCTSQFSGAQWFTVAEAALVAVPQ